MNRVALILLLCPVSQMSLSGTNATFHNEEGSFMFAYLVQSDKCVDISEFRSSRSEAILLTWGETLGIECSGSIFYPNSTRVQGWNRLYSELLIRHLNASSRLPFQYIVFVDSSAKLVPMRDSRHSSGGDLLAEFEEYLIEYEPALCWPRLLKDTPELDPDAGPIHAFHDHLLALHVETTPILLPFTERFDDHEWPLSVQAALGSALYREGMLHIDFLGVKPPFASAAPPKLHPPAIAWIATAARSLEDAALMASLPAAAAAPRFKRGEQGRDAGAWRVPDPSGHRFDGCHTYFAERRLFYRDIARRTGRALDGPGSGDPYQLRRPAGAEECLGDGPSEAEQDAGVFGACNLSRAFRDFTLPPAAIRWIRLAPAAPGGPPRWRLRIDGCRAALAAAGRADVARRCLARSAPRGVLLVGDSITRYQYLNLAHFLATGEWDSPHALPNENERAFANWTRFFEVTTARMRGLEVCDCHRGEGGVDPAGWAENRYLEEPARGARVYYMQLAGNGAHRVPFRQRDPAQLNATCNGAFPDRYASLRRFFRRAAPCAQAHCAPGACRGGGGPAAQDSPDGTLRRRGALAAAAASVLPSEVVLNAGAHWRGPVGLTNGFATPAAARRLRREAAALRRALGAAAPRLHWKMTTQAGHSDAWAPEYDFADALLAPATRRADAGGEFAGVFDAYALTRALFLSLASDAELPLAYWDLNHFHGPVYTELNKALIAYICSLPPTPTLVRPQAPSQSAGDADKE